MERDWNKIQESAEKVIEASNRDNTVKIRIDMPGVVIYNIPKQNTVRIDITTK